MIESEANKIWKSDRYNLVFNYYFKPLLPAPLVLVSYVIILIRNLIRQCYEMTDLSKKYNHKNTIFSRVSKFLLKRSKTGLVRKLKKAEENNLIKWEAYNTDEYIYNCEKEQMETVKNKIKESAEK